MSTSFPTSLDTLTNPTANDTEASLSHMAQHGNANDAIEALEAKVGVDGSAVTTSLDYKIGINTPAGILVLSGRSTAPTGWLICDGSAISRTTYSALFSAIGTTFGSGDGSTTFNIPDLRDNFPVGKSGTKALGSTGGAASINIAHTHTGPSHKHTIGAVESTKRTTTDGSGDIYADSAHTHGGNTGASGTGATSSSLSSTQSILPPYIALNYIIKI